MKNAAKTIASIGERAFIRRLCSDLPTRPDVILPVGDDTAVVRCGAVDLALTSDAVLQDRHFLSSDDPHRIGHKALARALSDLAAMGAEAAWVLVDLEIPGTMPTVFIDALYAGIRSLAERFQVAIVGGDTTESTQFGIHVFAVGTLPIGSARRRNGARAEDVVMVTGSLGDSRRGHHLDFTPRLAEGRLLRDHVHAMIDISDGLSVDAHHLATASGVRIVLDAAAIPKRFTHHNNLSDEALQKALNDGEDFELLFTLAPEKIAPLIVAWKQHFTEPPPVVIGHVEPGSAGLWLRVDNKHKPLNPDGYDHFKPCRQP